MTKDKLVTVREGVSQSEAKKPVAPAPHREAPGGRRSIPLRRPDYREGYREGGRQSERLQGRAGPPARRRRDHGRRQGFRPHRGVDRRRRRSGRGRHRARPLEEWCSTPSIASRECRTRCRWWPAMSPPAEGAKALIDCGADCHQGRHRPRFDLHYAYRRRRRRAAADRDHGLRRCGEESRHPGDRRRRHQIFRRSRQGA